MTEEQWLRGTEYPPMITQVRKRGTNRKRRLAMCAFCRDCERGIKDERYWAAVELGERWAEAGYEPGEQDMRNDLFIACLDLAIEATATRDPDVIMCAVTAMSCIGGPDPLGGFEQKSGWARFRTFGRNIFRRLNPFVSAEERRDPDTSRWPHILRDIFGNPFRRVRLDPACKTATAVALARSIYADRAFERMPILADALQDAGCENADILNHCRDAGTTHVRGCWVVDQVLGKR